MMSSQRIDWIEGIKFRIFNQRVGKGSHGVGMVGDNDSDDDVDGCWFLRYLQANFSHIWYVYAFLVRFVFFLFVVVAAFFTFFLFCYWGCSFIFMSVRSMEKKYISEKKTVKNDEILETYTVL